MQRTTSFLAAGLLFLVCACSSEQEPPGEVADARATNDAPASEKSATPAVVTEAEEPPANEVAGSMVLVAPAAAGLPEVRYYSLGGA